MPGSSHTQKNRTQIESTETTGIKRSRKQEERTTRARLPSSSPHAQENDRKLGRQEHTQRPTHMHASKSSNKQNESVPDGGGEGVERRRTHASREKQQNSKESVPDGGRGGVELVDAELLDQGPVAAGVRVHRGGLEQESGGSVHEGPIDNVRVASDPANVGDAAVDVPVSVVKHVLFVVVYLCIEGWMSVTLRRKDNDILGREDSARRCCPAQR